MGQRRRHSKEIKLQAIEDYRSGKKKMADICKHLDVYESQVYRWEQAFKKAGVHLKSNGHDIPTPKTRHRLTKDSIDTVDPKDSVIMQLNMRIAHLMVENEKLRFQLDDVNGSKNKRRNAYSDLFG